MAYTGRRWMEDRRGRAPDRALPEGPFPERELGGGSRFSRFRPGVLTRLTQFDYAMRTHLTKVPLRQKQIVPLQPVLGPARPTPPGQVFRPSATIRPDTIEDRRPAGLLRPRRQQFFRQDRRRGGYVPEDPQL